MPVPPGTPCIDLALTAGVPDFVTTLRVVLSEMQVQGHLLARETLEVAPTIAKADADRLLWERHAREIAGVARSHSGSANGRYHHRAAIDWGWLEHCSERS